MARWVIEVPGWRPALDNELLYVHWGTAARRKKQDVAMIGRAALVTSVPRATGKRRLTVWLWGRYSGRATPDESAPLKSLQDALVRNGLLVDDSKEWLELDWPPVFLRGAKKTVIFLEDIDIS